MQLIKFSSSKKYMRQCFSYLTKSIIFFLERKFYEAHKMRIVNNVITDPYYFH